MNVKLLYNQPSEFYPFKVSRLVVSLSSITLNKGGE